MSKIAFACLITLASLSIPQFASAQPSCAQLMEQWKHPDAMRSASRMNEHKKKLAHRMEKQGCPVPS